MSVIISQLKKIKNIFDSADFNKNDNLNFLIGEGKKECLFKLSSKMFVTEDELDEALLKEVNWSVILFPDSILEDEVINLHNLSVRKGIRKFYTIPLEENRVSCDEFLCVENNIEQLNDLFFSYLDVIGLIIIPDGFSFVIVKDEGYFFAFFSEKGMIGEFSLCGVDGAWDEFNKYAADMKDHYPFLSRIYMRYLPYKYAGSIE